MAEAGDQDASIAESPLTPTRSDKLYKHLENTGMVRRLIMLGEELTKYNRESCLVLKRKNMQSVSIELDWGLKFREIGARAADGISDYTPESYEKLSGLQLRVAANLCVSKKIVIESTDIDRPTFKFLVGTKDGLIPIEKHPAFSKEHQQYQLNAGSQPPEDWNIRFALQHAQYAPQEEQYLRYRQDDSGVDITTPPYQAALVPIASDDKIENKVLYSSGRDVPSYAKIRAETPIEGVTNK